MWLDSSKNLLSCSHLWLESSQEWLEYWVAPSWHFHLLVVIFDWVVLRVYILALICIPDNSSCVNILKVYNNALFYYFYTTCCFSWHVKRKLLMRFNLYRQHIIIINNHQNNHDRNHIPEMLFLLIKGYNET